MNKHTPGPWKIVSVRRDHIAPCFVDIDGAGWSGLAKVVVRMDGADADREDGVANAHLIAAAPDLYEALREVVAISDRKHDAWDKAKAALAKAEGKA